jgi:hypothetical protein
MNGLFAYIFVCVVAGLIVIAIARDNGRRDAYIKEKTENPWPKLLSIARHRIGCEVTFKEHGSLPPDEQALLDQGYIEVGDPYKYLRVVYPGQGCLVVTEKGWEKISELKAAIAVTYNALEAAVKNPTDTNIRTAIETAIRDGTFVPYCVSRIDDSNDPVLSATYNTIRTAVEEHHAKERGK